MWDGMKEIVDSSTLILVLLLARCPSCYCVTYVYFETYNFDISLHEKPQLKWHNQKCAKTQIRPFRRACRSSPGISPHPTQTAKWYHTACGLGKGSGEGSGSWFVCPFLSLIRMIQAALIIFVTSKVVMQTGPPSQLGEGSCCSSLWCRPGP